MAAAGHSMNVRLAYRSFVLIVVHSLGQCLYTRTDLDHTADVQCHAWGGDMQTAFENMAQCLMNYMTDLSLVEEAADETVQLTVSGNDWLVLFGLVALA
jgi:hypothetical protein